MKKIKFTIPILIQNYIIGADSDSDSDSDSNSNFKLKLAAADADSGSDSDFDFDSDSNSMLDDFSNTIPIPITVENFRIGIDALIHFILIVPDSDSDFCEEE